MKITGIFGEMINEYQPFDLKVILTNLIRIFINILIFDYIPISSVGVEDDDILFFKFRRKQIDSLIIYIQKNQKLYSNK